MDISHINKDIVEKLETPVLVISESKVQDKYTKIKDTFENIDIYYAIKANSDDQILKILDDLGCNFEIASISELDQLISLGISPERIISSNPIKISKFIEKAYEYGVNRFSFDSYQEIDKIERLAPKSQVYLRLKVDNEGSDWPLTNKFGVDKSEAIPLMEYAQSKNLDVIGLNFHVGSQCLNLDNWEKAMKTSAEIFQLAKDININLSFLNLGGGIPVKYKKEIPNLNEIKKVIKDSFKSYFQNFQNTKLVLEPGWGLIGDCGYMVAEVILLKKNNEENWIYLDVGVYNGLMETLENFSYELFLIRNGNIYKDNVRKIPYNIAGPSCDSIDIMFKNYDLPEDIKLGDKIIILNTGAYTTACSTSFNGLITPEIYINN